MKKLRQETIIDIITHQTITTQGELAQALADRGIVATQATVSRDMKELRLVKTMNDEGVYRYDLINAEEGDEVNERLIRLFRDVTVKMEAANNLIVIKTISGSANAAGEAVDVLHSQDVLGTIAGDNTLLVILRSNEATEGVLQRFRSWMA